MGTQIRPDEESGRGAGGMLERSVSSRVRNQASLAPRLLIQALGGGTIGKQAGVHH